MSRRFNISKTKDFDLFVGLVALAIIIIIGAKLNLNLDINGDVAWYLVSSERMMLGASNAEAYFDTNPPMSFFIYTPVIYLHWLTGLSKETSLLLFNLAVILFNASALMLMLRKNFAALGCIISIIYVYTLLFITMNLGHKDNLIALAIIPFITAQFNLSTTQDESKKLEKWTIAINAPFLLIKPHFLIIPAFFILWRTLKAKSFSQFFQFDSVILSLFGIGYILIVSVFFRDFLFEILPITSSVYSFKIEGILIAIERSFAYFVACGISFFSALFFLHDGKSKRYAYCLLASTFFASTIFIAQGVGFLGHLIPAFVLLVLLMCFIAVSVSNKLLNTNILLTLISAFAISGSVAALQRPANEIDTQLSKSMTQLAEILKKEDANAFYIESPITHLPYVTAINTGIEHASRFPSRWLLDFKERNLAQKNNDAFKSDLIKKFGNMLADDIKKYNADFLFFYDTSTDTKSILFPEIEHRGILYYLKDHEKFQKVLAEYKDTNDRLLFNYGTKSKASEKQLIAYKIYKRH